MARQSRPPKDPRLVLEEEGLPAVLSIHPDVKPEDSIGVVWARPTPHLLVEVYLGSGPAGLNVTEVRVEPWDHEGTVGLTSSDLRHIRLPEILKQAESQIAELDVYTTTPPVVADALYAVAKGQAPELKRGRTGYGDDHYRLVALEYLRLQAQRGQRQLRGPLGEVLGDRLGRGTIPEGTVRDWLVAATRRGFLTSPGRGRAGREAGPNLTTAKESN